GWITARPVSDANRPLWTIWSKNGGASSAACDSGGESRTASTMRIGMPPSAAASSHVRQRRAALASSTRNIVLPHEREEHVLERVALRDEGPHGDPGRDERGVD